LFAKFRQKKQDVVKESREPSDACLSVVSGCTSEWGVSCRW